MQPPNSVTPSPIVHAEENACETAILDALLAIARETGASAGPIAIAWLLEKARRSTTALVPIIGPSNREQLDRDLEAASVGLSQERFAHIEKISTVSLGVPHGIPHLVDVPPGRIWRQPNES